MTIEYRNVMGNAAAVGKTLHGQVTPFNSVTVIGDLRGDGFREQIAPGAFNKTLREQDIVLLWNHNTDEPLARMSAGNLRLKPDNRGLQYEAEPVDTQRGQDALKLAKAKVVKGCSFGFQVIRDSWTDDAGNPSDKTRGTNRTIHELRAHEVSVVTFPAYNDTSVSVRSMTPGEQKNAAASGEYAVALARGFEAFEEAHDRHIRSVMEAHMNDEGRESPKPYGDVTYADPKNGKYPVDTLKHAKAAWAYINMPKNAAHYPLNGVELADVKARIKAALKKFGVEISEDEERFCALAWLDDSYDIDEVIEGAEQRDYQDGDDPGGEFYRLWSHGAIMDICNLVDNGYEDQVPTNVVAALKVVDAYRKSIVAKQAGEIPGQGQEKKDGGGETPASPTGPNVGERSLEEVSEELRMRAAMVRINAEHFSTLLRD